MDASTLAPIATAAVAALASFFGKAGEESGKRLGADIYDALKDRAGRSPRVAESLTELEAAPDDADVQASTRLQLRKCLMSDAEMLSTIRAILGQLSGPSDSGSVAQHAGDHATQFGVVGRDVRIG